MEAKNLKFAAIMKMKRFAKELSESLEEISVSENPVLIWSVIKSRVLVLRALVEIAEE